MTTLETETERATELQGIVVRRHPLAKLAASLIIAFGLILSIDVVSGGIAVVFALLLVPVSGLHGREFWLRTAPIWIRSSWWHRRRRRSGSH